jgi:outer membrane receptor for ferrienterochelin and colicins
LNSSPEDIVIAVFYGLKNRIKLLLFCVLTVYKAGYAQSTQIMINDKMTHRPVPFAQVMIVHSGEKKPIILLSDQKGIADIPVSPPFSLSIKSMGYKPYYNTINTKKPDTIFLSPDYLILDKIIVTGQFRPQTVDKSIYSIDVIDNRQITLKAAGNLGDLMRNNPAFQYRSQDILGDEIRIRGLTGEHVKILIDGMPVTGRQGDRIELDQLSLNSIDHVEIIEGPMSIIYGSNAMAGAINLITSDFSKEELLAGINAYYETLGIYNFDAIFSRRIGKHTFSVNAGRNFNSGWGPVDTARNKIWKPKLQYIAGGTYRFKSEKVSLHYTTDFLDEELRDLGPLTLENLYEKALDGYHYTTRWNNSLNIIGKIGTNLALNIQSGYSYYQKRKVTYLNDLVHLEKIIADNPLLQDTTRFHLFTERGYLSGSYEKLEYQSGIDVSYETAEGKRTQGRQEISDIAGFLNIIYTPIDILSIQPGLRIMHNSKFDAPLVYAFNIKYNPGPLTMRASYVKGFNAPSLKQLYLEFIDNNHEVYGNPSLKAETGNSYNVSADYAINFDKSSVTLSASVFYNSIRNAIQLAVDTLRPGWGTYFNVEGENYKTKGVELNISSYLFSRLTLNGGLIATGQNRMDKPGSYLYSTDFSFSGICRVPRYNSEIALYYKHSGDFLEFAGNFNASGELDGIAQRNINGYNILDITYSRYLLRQRLIVSAGVKNLFNVKLVDSAGNLNFHGSSSNETAIGYGRTYFIKLGYKFDK